MLTLVIHCGAIRNIVISPAGRWVLNTIEGSSKVKNLLRSPLYNHLGALDSKRSLGSAKPVDMKDEKSSEFFSFLWALLTPWEPVKEHIHLRKRRYISDVTHKMLVASSGTNSSSSYQSTSSARSATSKGLLHCIWKSTVPFFVFSVDDQGEIYVANPYKLKSSDDNTLNYMYLFHSRTDSQTEQECSSDDVSDVVGKMKVLSSLGLDSNNLKLVETEFVMFGASEDSFGTPLTPTPRKNKGLPKKVVDVFRTNYSSKHKSTQKTGDQSSILEYFPQETCLDMFGRLDNSGKDNLFENHPPCNLELASIVVKEYHHDNSQVSDGGWGLKFLESVPVECADNPLNSSSESCGASSRNKNEALVNMKVLVPVSFHGSPRNGSEGPSSLIERWRSGGHCDCGGWDTGCPLTVLNSRSSNTESWPETEKQEHCKSFDLYIEGAKQGVPSLKMVNIHEGLYLVHFQSPLSALQSFSIGVAIIHTQSPTLYP